MRSKNPKPFYHDRKAGIVLYHGDALELMPRLGRFDLLMSNAAWDPQDPHDFAAFSMSWLAMAHAIAPELVAFAADGTVFRDLVRLLWPRVRQVIWSKPIGSQYNGASEARLWFAHELVFHCHATEYQEAVEPKTREVAELLKVARKSIDVSRGAVDLAVRGKRTGLCFRWEEGACIPTRDQVRRLKEVLPLGAEFMAALERAEAARNQVLERSFGQTSERAAELADVLVYRTQTGGEHPTEKPVALMADLLRTVGAGAQSILDPFAGSGSTLVAAKGLGIRAVGIERERRFCELAARRLAQGVLFAGERARGAPSAPAAARLPFPKSVDKSPQRA